MLEDQENARENARRLTRLRGWSLKDLAEASGLSVSSVYNWSKHNAPNELGPKAITAIAEALGVTVEQMFYNGPHDKAGATQSTQGDWRDQLREIERYVRSIEDPIERLATIRRLLAIARTDVEEYERSVDGASPPAATAPGAGTSPRTSASRVRRGLKGKPA